MLTEPFLRLIKIKDVEIYKPVVNNLVLNQGDSIPSSSNGWANNVFRAEGIILNIQLLMAKVWRHLALLRDIHFLILVSCQQILIIVIHLLKKYRSFDILGRKCDLNENQFLLLFYSMERLKKDNLK